MPPGPWRGLAKCYWSRSTIGSHWVDKNDPGKPFKTKLNETMVVVVAMLRITEIMIMDDGENMMVSYWCGGFNIMFMQ